MTNRSIEYDKEADGAKKGINQNDQDIEIARTNKEHGDSVLVSWDGSGDPKNPQNWTKLIKWRTTLLVSLFTFLSPLSGTMISPALDAIAKDLDITNAYVTQLCLSIFLLGLGFAPLILSPLSEVYGRMPVLLLGNGFYLAWNLGCGFARTSGQMLAFRFLSGLGASAPLAIGAGLVSDLWDADCRGRAVAVYTFLPLLGPAVGPIAGGFITEDSTWRWIFWASSLASSVFQVLAISFLRETYGPRLLRNKARRLEKSQMGVKFYTEYEGTHETLITRLSINLIRPIRLLATQPIIQFLAFYMLTLSGILNDVFFRRLKGRNGGVSRPEYRVPLMVPGSLMVPTGLFIYVWAGQAHTHWIVPNIGTTIFAAGIILCFQSIQTCTIEGYTRYAASAIATLNLARRLTGFPFPAFAPYMYSSLGFGWGNSLLFLWVLCYRYVFGSSVRSCELRAHMQQVKEDDDRLMMRSCMSSLQIAIWRAE